jgi:hypothetical protein
MAFLGMRSLMDLELDIPPGGEWMLRGHLESGAPPVAGPVTVTVGDLVLVGRVLADRGGLDAPDFPAVVVAGGYGWRTVLPMGAFESPGGVRLSTVLGALADLCGETYRVPPELKLPSSYGWTAGTRGRQVLAELVSRGALPWWRVDLASARTVFAPWPTLGAADAHGVIEDRDLAEGARYVALSGSVAAWLPGATVQGATIARVQFRERDGETRATVWES